MKTNLKKLNNGFTLVELLVVISIIVVLAGIATPAAMKALNRAALVEGTNQVRNIKQGLDLFADDMNDEYPNDDTAIEIAEMMDDSAGGGSKRGLERSGGLKRGNLGDRGRAGSAKTSNEYFQQAIARRAIDSDEMFYHTNFKKAFKGGLKQPNSDKELSAGECVWGYTKDLLRTSSSHLPIVFDNPTKTGDNPEFSKKTWDGKIVVAYLDGSVRNENVGGSDRNQGPVRGKIDGETMNRFSEDALEEGTLVPANLRRSGN